MEALSKTKWNIYQISEAIREIIEHDVNEETGEIEYEVSEKLEAMQMAKEELTKNVVLYFKEAKAFQESVKAEKKRLSDMDSQLTTRLDKLKKFIRSNVEPGTKIKTEQFEISWRKSSGVEYDDSYLIDKLLTEEEYLQDLVKRQPELVKVEYSLRKREAVDLHVATGTLPQGLKFEDNRQNLQIK